MTIAWIKPDIVNIVQLQGSADSLINTLPAIQLGSSAEIVVRPISVLPIVHSMYVVQKYEIWDG